MAAPLRRLLLLAGALAGCAEPPDRAAEKETVLRQYSGYDVVHPIRVDESGSFLSYDLAHRAIHKRALSSRNNLLSFYELHYKGQHLKFNLSVNNNLLAPGFVSERRYGGITNAKIQSYNHNSCHMIGEVQNWALKGGLAALSTCDGLRGVFRLANEDYFIEPQATNKHEDGTARPHRIYKRHAPKYEEEESIVESSRKRDRKQPDTLGTCGVQESPQSLETSEKRRERWEQKQQRKRRIKQRSISKEKWVETLVVADTKMVEYHGSENIEKYVLTVMNMVAGIFHDASIGNPINIAIVRLILLEDDEEDLKITHHADNTLKSFCKWQKSINVKGDAHPLHHDVAVLLTRKDICAAMNRPCETLGLSHVSGMCQPHRSCNINEDTGLPLAFTVAHELGHSFGIQHDGSGNDCEPVGKRPFIMSPQLLYDTSPLTWSRCSREYVTRFLDRGWGLCLDDPPAKEVVDYPLVPPGVLYDVSHQCRLQYGAYSVFCDDMDNVCNTLWCSVGNTCHSKLDAAVDGTKCGENKWCFNGECVQVGYHPDSIDGGWGTWSSWSTCSRTCGAGVQNAERQCNNPTPKYGGKYCLGERKRFRVCNMKPCPTDKPSFRHIQCSQFDAMLYKGKLYKWLPVPNNINPCELHCRPEDEYFAEKLRDAVTDGTPCYEGNTSRDICINGICKNVGCDYEIDSNAVEDRCGVCHGDGSTCQTVKKMFEESEGLGYVDIGMIPAGAREIRIEEVAEAGNFLALRSEDPEKYFLNGGWTIQWNGDYKVAGTTFTYERTGNWENLTSPGPTGEPVWIQLLFQETNPGVRYQYTIQRESDHENEIQPAEFFWRYGSWTKCTATCGTGVQRQIVHCVEQLAGLVEERYCDSLTRPDDKQRTCSEEPCPARWWVGEWQKCSATCGEAGLMKRTVLCIQSVWLDEQRALQHTQCQHLSKPDATAPCNRDILCPAQWAIGNWSECSVTCGNGTQRRLVYCSNNSRTTCDPTQRPLSETTCSRKQCQKKIENANTDWSGSGSSSRELFNEINYIPSHHISHFSPSIPNNPKSKDKNVITEEDFSSSSNKKGNVFVDDFYYDYNFINFHEDLSYDPLGEKDIKSEGFKPDAEGEAANNLEDSNETSPNIPYNVKPEGERNEGNSARSETNTSADVHNEEKEKAGVGDNKTLFSITEEYEDIRTSTAHYITPSYIGEEEEDMHMPLSEDQPSTENGTRLYSINSQDNLPTDKTQGVLLTRTISEEDATVTIPSISYPYLAIPTPPLPVDKGSAGGEEMYDIWGSTGEPGSREEDGKSTEVPVNDSKDDGLADIARPSQEDTNEMDLVITDDGETDSKTKDEKAKAGITATAESADVNRPAHNPPPQPTTNEPLHPAAKDTPFLSTEHRSEQETGGTSEDTVPTMGSYNSDNKEPDDHTSHAEDVQNQLDDFSAVSQTHNPQAATMTALPLLWSMPPHMHKPSTQESRTLTSNSLAHQGAQAPAVPISSDPNPTAGPEGTLLALPAELTTAWWAEREANEIKTTHYTKDVFSDVPGVTHAGPNERAGPDESSPRGTQRIFANRDGEHGTSLPTPSLPDQQQQEAEAKEDSFLLLPATRAATVMTSWEVGSWSECSTTCGLGASWRTVHCSTGKDEDCVAANKPVPARRCYLRPCSSWRIGNWSKCSKNCGGGLKVRDVHCVDTREQRLLRPFHCQAVFYKPPVQTPCQTKPCLDWYTSSWRECSESCGRGEQERLVTCPEFGRCDEMLRPNNTRPCNTHPCTKWVVGSWGECTATCGGGIQQRQVKCMNTNTGEAEEDSSLCDHEQWPENTQKCNPQDCDNSESMLNEHYGELKNCRLCSIPTEDTSSPSLFCSVSLSKRKFSFICERDRLTFSFCQTLRILGRCHLPTVNVQCCRTCRQHGHSARDRGNERVSRR
ncbi:A disintegrin and metalloproteinase with thrombospondin motifs 7 isoform X1 [Chelonia mydas]|uniref:A disintegrin and metalloproteinase with thrombospondin motifs 7 isoform X1 n=2 Tax=Chelonia mydas TaxID=8469 RepID=UPI0018A24386|nr:A disintegrin and metalloproteinase with thrombospondin motifs 7 isoform X1 [Chelonia mydas]